MKVLALGASALLLILCSVRTDAQIDEDLGAEQPACLDAVVAAGPERRSLARARYSADDMWMGRVRFDYGERYVDINNAKDKSYLCVASTPVSPAVIIKRVYFRCMTTARPCQAPSTSLEKVPPTLYEETASSKPLLKRRPDDDPDPEPSSPPGPEPPAAPQSSGPDAQGREK
jgi:hypothetical protein